MEYDSAVKRTEVLTPVLTGRSPEEQVPREGRQTDRRGLTLYNFISMKHPEQVNVLNE